MAIEAVHQGDRGAKVATLHEGLLYLIRNQGGMVEQTREVLESQLAHDQVPPTFGTATASIVGLFQYQIKNRGDLPKPVKKRFANIPLLRKDDATGNGDVDNLTAEALNWLVRETAAYGPPPPFKPLLLGPSMEQYPSYEAPLPDSGHVLRRQGSHLGILGQH